MSSLRLTVKIVARQRADVVLEATDTAGTLKIDAQPSNAELTVDGKPIAPGTLEVEVPFGHHQVSARADGYNVVNETVDVLSAKGATWSVRLQKLAVAPAAKPEDDSGGHFDVALAGTLPLHSHIDVCPADVGNRTCDQGTRLGGGLLLRGGYNFGVIGIDLTALAWVDHGADTVDYPGGTSVSSVPEAAFQHTAEVRAARRRRLGRDGPHGHVARRDVPRHRWRRGRRRRSPRRVPPHPSAVSSTTSCSPRTCRWRPRALRTRASSSARRPERSSSSASCSSSRPRSTRRTRANARCPASRAK